MNATWSLLLSGAGAACTNMAVDQLLLERAGLPDARPVLRLYAWAAPAVTVGYFQDVQRGLDLPALARRGWPVVRRLTGGRAVFHDREMTYSVVLPRGAADGIRETYAVIGRAPLTGLAALGVRAEMEGRPRRGQGRDRRSADCFASVSWCEIVVQGRKLVGSAQRRVGDAVLQQGSILISRENYPAFREVLRRGEGTVGAPGDPMTSLAEVLDRIPPPPKVEEAVVGGFEQALGARFEPMAWGQEEENAVVRLVRSRYGRSDWNLLRKASNSK